MERQIVFVLSTNYAGSHFLALQLATHSHCVSLGELHRYKRPASRRRESCSICDHDEVCPVFRGLGDVPVEQIYDRLFANLASLDAGITTGIDNSKKPEWAQRFLDLSGYRLAFIHLVRDPRALVRRWALCYESAPAKAKVRRLMARRCWRHVFGIMKGSEANVYVHKWAYQNQRIRAFIDRHQLDAKRVTYRDLALFPERTLGDIMPWLGLTFEPSQLQYWTVRHHGSQKAHYMKPPPGGKTFYDLRWQTFLDPETQAEIATHPAVEKYLADEGITMLENGLTTHPAWTAESGDKDAVVSEGAS